MSRAVSREGFDERKNYLGVYMQQGRAVLDSDWNESQHITSSLLKRLTWESLGDGTPNQGFKVDRIFPIPLAELAADIESSMKEVDPADPGQGVEEVIQKALSDAVGNCVAWFFGILGNYIFAPLMFFIQFPGDLLDDGESLDGWELAPPQGNLRLARDVPFSGKAFLRVSGHPGTVRLVKHLPPGDVLDISEYELLVFRFRTNERIPGPIRFFMEDAAGGMTTWTFNNPALARDQWMAGFATPLDVRLHISTRSPLPNAYREMPDGGTFEYTTLVSAVGGLAPVEWEVSDGALPPGLDLVPASETGDPGGGRAVVIRGVPTEDGTFTFELTATDDDGAKATREFQITVEQVSPSDFPSPPLPGPLDVLQQLAIYEIGDEGPADPAQVVRYGVELYQEPGTPLAWDIDDLRLGSTALYEEMGTNNFILRGSELSQLQAQLALMGLIRDSGMEPPAAEDDEMGEISEAMSNVELDLLEILNTDFQVTRPGLEDAGRMYVDGYPGVLLEDTLYSTQADPDDPPIVTPAPGTGTREDTVYLDVWEEPVTFVEDPDIREIALGGPDTSTRLRMRQCVRVAQGRPMPTGSGRGRGLLATEGAYTGRDNRLFRVEIETPGQLGEATFRWSDENASVIARVIRSVEAGSRLVVVEDATDLLARDFVLIRCGLRQERTRIASVLDNVITVEQPLQGTYALQDRPRVERWNAFGVPIPPDPADPLVSLSIALVDGVRIRFGGRDMRRGDYWTFRTRYLARDQSAGVDPTTRMEDLGFVRPHGVRHHYVPLARITRNEGDGGRIHRIKDLRPRIGNAAVIDVGLPPLTALTAVGDAAVVEHVGGTLLPPADKESRFLVLVSGMLYVTGVDPATKPVLTLLAAFYNHARTDPASDPETGRIQDQERKLPLARVQFAREVPLHVAMVSSSTPYAYLPSEDFTPVSVEIFVSVRGANTTVELSNLRLTVVELKKSH